MSDMPTATARGTLVLLTRLNRQVYRAAIEAGIGMHPKQYAVLSILREQSRVTQQGLGTALHLDANTVVHLLNAVEEEGWAERRRDPDDRRRHIVVLTPKGNQALDRAEERFDALESEVLAGLSAEDQAKLTELLRRALGD